MNGVKLVYSGTGLGSNESFSVASVTEQADFSQAEDVISSEVAYQNYGNPCDLYSVSLDGSVSAPPENPAELAVDTKIGYWSNTQSTQNGEFAEPITISMIADEYFSSSGISLVFDEKKGIYATHLSIAWFRDIAKIAEKEFFPNSADYFCSQAVENYNKVDITFYSLNAPKNRLWLQNVKFGIVTEFSARNLKNSAIKQSFSPISERLPISTLSFTVFSDEGIDFIFEEKQPVTASFNGEQKGVFFVRKAIQSGEKIYSVDCEDYIGLLDGEVFNGGVYKERNAATLIREICSKAGVNVIVPPELEGAYIITGWLPRDTCRNALQQVLFVLQLYADTTETNGIVIRRLPEEKQDIPRSRVMQGIKFAEDKKITGVEIISHRYVPSTEESVLYDAKEDGYGDAIEVIFSEPQSGLSLENGSFIEWSSNHAIFNAQQNTRLRGSPYVHITTKKAKHSPIIASGQKPNVVQIEDATLVNSKNVDNILNNCYNYFTKTKSVHARIIEGKHEGESGYIFDETVSLGNTLSVETSFKGNVDGVLESQSYSMNGGILVKECVLKCE